MEGALSLVISALAFGVSAITAWLTLFRRGTVMMTQPTVIYFGADAPRTLDDRPSPKVYLRTLLFATSRRGRVVESLHVALSHNEARHNFNIWVYGEGALVRGSGLFVGENGVTANHHFLAPRDQRAFQFEAGVYQLEVFARLLGERQPRRLFVQTLEISVAHESALKTTGAGVYFDWGPDSSRYLPHVETRRPAPEPENLLEMLGLNR